MTVFIFQEYFRRLSPHRYRFRRYPARVEVSHSANGVRVCYRQGRVKVFHCQGRVTALSRLYFVFGVKHIHMLKIARPVLARSNFSVPLDSWLMKFSAAVNERFSSMYSEISAFDPRRQICRFREESNVL